MALETLGHYRIVQSLGAGGMGAVFLAEDTTLHRNIALKVLLDDVAADPDRRERFRREARAVAALSHPNIVTIHSVEEEQGRLFLTMEYVDGLPLTDAIPREGFPLDKLLSIAIPMADAVAAAHQAGITHRDLKPANVMIAADSRVKVLDFGLARLREDVVLQGATMTAPLTGEGRILGTAAYMSPEQAEGRPVDARSDLFSLGIVLFEMATGQRPFTGETQMSVLSAILKEAPRPISSIRPDVPRELARIIKRALQKDPEQRYQTAKDLRNDLQLLKAESDSGELTTAIAGGAHPRPRSAGLRLAAGAAALAVVALAGTAWWLLGSGSDSPVSRAEWVPVTDFADSATQPALSPDGRMLAFVRGNSTFTTEGDVYVKLLPNGEPVQLTHDSMQKMDPRFSPDGTEIAYTALDANFNWYTYIVPVLGGREPRLLLSNASGLSWTGEHQYLYSEIKSGIHMAVVTSGEGRADERDIYVPPTKRGMAHRSQLSPDGKHILISEEMDLTGVLPCRVVPADGSNPGVTVGPPNSTCFNGVWTPDGRSMILALQTGSGTHLWRQRYPNGAPEQITFGPTEEVGIAISPDGSSLITSAGGGHDTVWLHDAGGDHQIVSEGAPEDLEFSTDGTRLFFRDKSHGVAPDGGDTTHPVLRAYDLQRRRVDTVLGGVSIGGFSISPDGKLVAYISSKDHEPHIWVSPLDGSLPARQVVRDAARFPSFGPDGLLYYSKVVNGAYSPWKINVAGGDPVRAGEFAGAIVAVSPDNSWVMEWHIDATKAQFGGFLRRASDGHMVELSCGMCFASWPDARHFAVRTLGSSMGAAGRTYIFTVSPEKPVPDGLERMTDIEEFARERGARVLPHAAVLNRANDTYAYLQYSAQRNLYRVPLR